MGKVTMTAMVGRPSTFSPEVAGAICQELMAGKSLREICAMEGMPGTSTVYSWLREHPEFQDAYALAREVQADMLADEVIHIADTEPDPNRARVMIDARKWLASKLRPKKYGDRVGVDHTVENKTGMNVVVNVVPAPVTPATIDVEPEKPALPSAGADSGASGPGGGEQGRDAGVATASKGSSTRTRA